MNIQGINQNLQTMADTINSLHISAGDAARIMKINQLINAVAQELNKDKEQPPVISPKKPEANGKAA